MIEQRGKTTEGGSQREDHGHRTTCAEDASELQQLWQGIPSSGGKVRGINYAHVLRSGRASLLWVAGCPYACVHEWVCSHRGHVAFITLHPILRPSLNEPGLLLLK